MQTLQKILTRLIKVYQSKAHKVVDEIMLRALGQLAHESSSP